MAVSAEQAIDGIQDAFGAHAGRRVLHPWGAMLRGSFRASSEAAALTRAPVMQGEDVPVLARVSNGGGDPRVPDFMPDVRGLAVALDPDAGERRLDILAQTSPRMPVRTPDEFVEMMRALHPGVESLWRLPWFLGRHPRAAREFARAGRDALAPPESYATCRYHAVHAYRWVGADGAGRWVRYVWEPEAGDRRLSLRAARGLGRAYLHEEIAGRVAGGPVRFRLVLVLAAAGDDPHDPSVAWPVADRERVEAGVLSLDGVEETSLEDRVVFDPARVPDGIELSDDPLLRFRPAAYSVSASRRGLG